MDDEMQLLVAFPDGSASFVNGFEAGEIAAEMKSGSTEPIDRGYDLGLPVHTDNVEVIRRMAQAWGYRVETKPECVEGWTPLLLTYVGEGRAKPSLRVV